jgi:hypothetical protein
VIFGVFLAHGGTIAQENRFRSGYRVRAPRVHKSVQALDADMRDS